MERFASSSISTWMRHTVSTIVGPLAVWERGTGPAVVLRHGIFFDHTLWEGQAHALADHFRVVVIDAPGHGKSGDPGRPYSLAEDALATVDVLDHLSIASASLVGHSWGGMSAVRTALASPKRVHALALINTPLEAGSIIARARYSLLRAVVLAVGAPKWYSAQVAAAMFSAASRRNMAELTPNLQQQLVQADRHLLARSMSAVLVHPDSVLDRLGALTQPVMVLAGDEDYVLPERTRSSLTHAVPGATVDTLPGRHVLPLEQPVETLRRLKAFLPGGER
jgi:pimeloyl-ACP methyl ester carboxylesterase